MKNPVAIEYRNTLEAKLKIEASLSVLPHGYVSQKTIKGRSYCYLQSRVSGKLTSRYLKADEIEPITVQIALRKEQEIQLAALAIRLNELEQAALLLDKALYRQLMLLKVSAGMDSINASQRNRSASFASAMNAIEGIAVSRETQQDILSWQTGSASFLSAFEATLRRYGFPGEVQ